MSGILMPEIARVPPLLSTDVKPFGYQTRAIDAVRSEFKKGVRSTLVVMATGLGKTIMAAFIARGLVSNGKRLLFLVHTDELAEQAMDKFRRCGLWPSLEKAGSYARSMYPEPNCVVASRQTLKGDRLESWPEDYFWCVIADEAHHATSKENTNIFKHFSSARRLLITATPNRTDGVPLVGNICETKAFEMSLLEALTAPAPGPFLARPIIRDVDIEIDLRALKKRKGKFNKAELDDIVLPKIEDLANAVFERIGDRKTILFLPGVQSSEAMAAALRSESIGLSAEGVWGNDKDRKMKMQRFKNSEFQVLCNCQLATEGVDFPDVTCVGICRPSDSYNLIAQMVGRGLRLHPGKESCVILDFAWMTNKHDIFKPLDLLIGGGLSKEVLERAKRNISSQKDKEIDLLDAIAKADREVQEHEKIEMNVNRKHVKAKRDLTYDPIERALNSLGLTPRTINRDWIPAATEKQLHLLKKNGFDGLDDLDKETASEMVGKVMEINNSYKENNKPSISQRRLLMKQRYTVDQLDSMSRTEATEIIGSLMVKFAGKKRA